MKQSPDLTLSDIERLEKSQCIPANQIDPIRKKFRDSIQWQAWLGLLTGMLGALFLLSGLMFFFAANWKDMSPMVRLGSVQVLVVAMIAITLLVKKNQSLWLLGASFLTGILLAVFGQVYQTGADAFEVYILWAALILPWVLLGRSLALWSLWLVVLQTAICLFTGQYLVPSGFPWEWGIVTLGALNLLAVAVFEFLNKNSQSESTHWFAPAFLTMGLIWLTMLPFPWIFDFGYLDAIGFASIIWLAAVILVFFYYYKVKPSSLGMGLALMSAATVLVTAAGRFLLDDKLEMLAAWFVLALISILVFGGAATLLIKFHKSLQTKAQ